MKMNLEEEVHKREYFRNVVTFITQTLIIIVN